LHMPHGRCAEQQVVILLPLNALSHCSVCVLKANLHGRTRYSCG